MSEAERRRSYWYNAILIESDRVLNPVHDDAVIYVTGAQVELLRNVAQYLRRRQTYVDETQPGYYLVPDDEDYDEILAIVADLEETLMGNPNTIFGYDDVKALANDRTVSGAGDETLTTGACPAGEIWRIEGISAGNDATVCSRIEVLIATGGLDSMLLQTDNPPAASRVIWNGMATIKPGGNVQIEFYGCQDGDYIDVTARGYRMKLPA